MAAIIKLKKPVPKIPGYILKHERIDVQAVIL
jgi:hypothetical protein